MRRHRSTIALAIGAAGLALAAAQAAGQVPPPPVVAPAPPPTAPAAAPERRPAGAMGLTGILVPTVPPMNEREIAGLPPRAPAGSLTWRRVYELAVIRARSGETSRPEALDPGALAEQSRRHGAADFARFRREFLAGRTESGAAFHDPGAAYLDLLRRAVAIDFARRHVAKAENTLKLLADLIQGENAGLSQLDVDLATEALVRARRGLRRAVASYRDALDTLKVELGLSPHAAVLPDLGEIAGFLGVGDHVEAWQRHPDRNLATLPRILAGLPAPGDVAVNGRPILPEINPNSYWIENPDPIEDMLKEAAGLAVKNRPRPDKSGATADDAALELQVRRRLRRLLENRRDYEEQKRLYELAIRLQDHAFERLVGASGLGGPGSRTAAVREMIDQFEHAREAMDPLAATWATFRADRLALYRDIGILPFETWDAFLADLSAGPAVPDRAAPQPPAGLVPATGPG
jgi:tetratricopeptide (TPR) repeat protein